MADDLYRPEYVYPSPLPELAPVEKPFYRSSHDHYTTIHPGSHRLPTHQLNRNYRLVSNDRLGIVFDQIDEYHFDVPMMKRGLPPPDYASYFRPSKMIKTEGQGVPAAQYQETAVGLGRADDEPSLYHKLPAPDTTVKREGHVLHSSRAPETFFGRLPESVLAEGTSQVLRPHDRPNLVPSGPTNVSQGPKAASRRRRNPIMVIPKVFKQSKAKLKTCRDLMDGTRKSLANRYENDPRMKKPAVYGKLGELDRYLRQIEDGLAGALATAEELCQLGAG